MQANTQAAPLKADTTAKKNAIIGQLEALRSHGGRSGQRVARLRHAIEQQFFQERSEEDVLESLQELLETLKTELGQGEWSDRARAHIIFQLAERLADAPETLPYINDNIKTWLTEHHDAPSVVLCLKLVPPDGISVVRVLDSGAQKQVFVAKWPEVTSLPVALKHFKAGTLGHGQQHLGDAFPHPLRGHLPNIIETFVLSEDKDSGEVFLVERLLGQTLKDGWDFGGVAEVANLIRDIGNALSFVHGQSHMHGDIKLDNMGIESGRYILLDFGLCRREASVTEQMWTPTGNLRTRAPELLRENQPNSSKSDVWALGAVAFQALVGHPPLFRQEEKQAGFLGSEREEAIDLLAERADPARWNAQVSLPLQGAVPEYDLRGLLEGMLAFDANARPTAAEVVSRCDMGLGWMVRPAEPTPRLSPLAELDQLHYLYDKGDLALASKSRRLELGEVARRLQEISLSASDAERLGNIESAL